jgi:hypothetical protein
VVWPSDQRGFVAEGFVGRAAVVVVVVIAVVGLTGSLDAVVGFTDSDGTSSDLAPPVDVVDVAAPNGVAGLVYLRVVVVVLVCSAELTSVTEVVS